MAGKASRSRGIVVRVLVFLLLGAVVNVAVAWECVAADETQCYVLGGELVDPTKSDLGYAASLEQTWDKARFSVRVSQGIGWTCRQIPIEDKKFWEELRKVQERFGAVSVLYVAPSVDHVSAGWPAECVSATLCGDRVNWGVRVPNREG